MTAADHYNQGGLYVLCNRPDKAASEYRRAIALSPNWAAAHFNLGCALIACGRFTEGWAEYEWRLRCSDAVRREMGIPDWDGVAKAGSAEQSLVVYQEQGYGDTIQFMRFLPRVQSLWGGVVRLEVRLPLYRLARQAFPSTEPIVLGERIPPAASHCVAMMSLPHILGLTTANIPTKPYLRADRFVSRNFKEVLDQHEGFKIGICWAGRARSGEDLVADAIGVRRSIPLLAFRPLMRIPGIVWVSLQKGGSHEVPPEDVHLHDPTEDLEDFFDTAALIDNLDLVISADTAVVHLAGAMGKPVWMLSRYDTCWRWMGHRHDSPWYPSLRQFAQTTPGDWLEVMDRVSIELEPLVDDAFRQRRRA